MARQNGKYPNRLGSERLDIQTAGNPRQEADNRGSDGEGTLEKGPLVEAPGWKSPWRIILGRGFPGWQG